MLLLSLQLGRFGSFVDLLHLFAQLIHCLELVCFELLQQLAASAVESHLWDGGSFFKHPAVDNKAGVVVFERGHALSHKLEQLEVGLGPGLVLNIDAVNALERQLGELECCW